MCGGTLQADLEKKIAVCDSCGTEQTIPSLDDEKKANMFDRANHFRVNNEYDKALSMYEKLLELDGNDAEIYWSVVLCKYGIEYVEDPATHKRIPTINRLQYDSILTDGDYKMALEKANSYQKRVYENEAQIISNIQKDILAISKQEEPFDVFICYKETDNNGRRTKDSVLANDLYHQLSNEGFKVFFARITLEDKLGEQYEPFIFAALNSAKVMVVLGTNKDYFNAVWVKNEWSRFLTLAKKDSHKTLIPAYKDMDPYDLPEEFSHLQAQDMSKLGFMSDLIRGIKKILALNSNEINSAAKAETSANGNVVALLKRAKMALEDGEFVKADGFCEEVLNQDAENGEAYFIKFLAEYQASSIDEFVNNYNGGKEYLDSLNYKKVVKFANTNVKQEIEALNKKTTDKDFIKCDNELQMLGVEFIDSNIGNIVDNLDIDTLKKNVEQVLCLKQWFERNVDHKNSQDKIAECNQIFEHINNCLCNLLENEDIIFKLKTFIVINNMWQILPIVDNNIVEKYIKNILEVELSETKVDSIFIIKNSYFLGVDRRTVILLCFLIGCYQLILQQQDMENKSYYLDLIDKKIQYVKKRLKDIAQNHIHDCASELITKYQQLKSTGIMPNEKSMLDAISENKPDNKKVDTSVTKVSEEEVKKEGCYVASAVYGSYDCPQVWVLRRFRDYTLAETWYGRAFIKSYYATSPTVVKYFGKNQFFVSIFKPMLDRLVMRLKLAGVLDTAYKDRDW